MRLASCLVVIVCMAAGCATQPPRDVDESGHDSHGGLWPRDDVSGLPNFAQVTPGLYRGAQPTEAGFRVLHDELGVRTVINLCASDDQSLFKAGAFRYVHIPMQAWNIKGGQVRTALDAIQDPANQPVYIHCQRGADRTGCVVGAYRIAVEGWSAKAAKMELDRFRSAKVFGNIRDFLDEVAKQNAQPAQLTDVQIPTGKPASN